MIYFENYIALFFKQAMESEEYKEICKIVIRHINNCKGKLNTAVQHETKIVLESLQKISDAMTVLCYKGVIIWNKTLNQKTCFVIKLSLISVAYFFFLTIFVKDRFLFAGMLMMKFNQEGFFGGNIVDCQHKYRLKVQKEMEF